MRKICKFASVVLVAAAMLAGCCNCRSFQRKHQRPLVGTEWQLVQLGGEKITPSNECFTLTLQSEESRLVGKGDCNQLTGVYTASESRALNFTQLGSTRMLCPNAEREARFVEALEKTTHYDMDGAMLLLLSNGDLVAVLQAKQPRD